MGRKHWYGVEEVIYPLQMKFVRVYCFESTESRQHFLRRCRPSMEVVGSTNRYVTTAIKLSKKGQEWPIDVNKD